jgi:hypothetical protein
MAHPPSIRRRLSSAFSFASSTNATESDITGAGRTVGRLLSASGRGLEAFLSRTAERMGVGPNSLVKRLITAVRGCHNASCQPVQVRTRAGQVQTMFEEVINELVGLCTQECCDCKELYMQKLTLTEDALDCVEKLVLMIRCVAPKVHTGS